MGWPGGAGAAIHIQLVARNAQFLRRRHSDDGKSFVDLEQIDITDMPAALVEHLADRRDGRGREPAWFLTMRRMRLDLGEDRQAFAFGDGAAGQDQRRSAVGIGG